MNKTIIFSRGMLVGTLIALLSACSTPPGSAVDVPVEERGHGVITAYRINPQDRDKPASSGSALKQLSMQADKQSRARRYTSAAATLERALRIAPRKASLWQQLAQVRLKQGRWSLASNMAAKSNSLAGDDTKIQAQNWRIIARASQYEGKRQAATEAWQHVRQLENR